MQWRTYSRKKKRMKYLKLVVIVMSIFTFVGCDSSESPTSNSEKNEGVANFIATVDGDAVSAYWKVYVVYEESSSGSVFNVDPQIYVNGTKEAFSFILDFDKCAPNAPDPYLKPTGELIYKVSKSGYEDREGSVFINIGDSKTKIVALVSE